MNKMKKKKKCKCPSRTKKEKWKLMNKKWTMMNGNWKLMNKKKRDTYLRKLTRIENYTKVRHVLVNKLPRTTDIGVFPRPKRGSFICWNGAFCWRKGVFIWNSAPEQRWPESAYYDR